MSKCEEGKTLYLECQSGISGDMTVGALLDLGANQKVLEDVLKSLPVDGYAIKISRVKKAGLDVCDFDVILDEAHHNHDHDMEYLHGHEHHDHHHEHEHHDHHHEHHHHEHRGLVEVLSIIDQGDMTEGARKMAKKIFNIIAEAEAKAHGVPLEEVHFHEVGAVDSIVDVISVAVCVDNLGITDCIISSLTEGMGTVRCQHGILPVPVPAVTNIVATHHLKLQVVKIKGELVTPTGAAIAAALCTSKELPDTFTIEKVGMGAGKRQYERPSILRAMIIDQTKEERDSIYKLESNIDDSTGEALGYVMEQLLSHGARDVYYIPVYMKKNRPAYELNVVCKEADISSLEHVIFTETTTIGIRRTKMERTILPRTMETITTSLGEVHVKVCTIPGDKDMERRYPEYDSVVSLCQKHNLSFQEVFGRILQEMNEHKE